MIMAGSKRIRTVNVAITATISGLEKALKKAQKSLKNAGKEMTAIGQTLSKNVTAPIAAVGTALAAMTLKAAKSADDLADLSSVTGISTTQLQQMSYAGTILGTDLETMTGAQTKLTRSIYDAVNGNKEAIQSFQNLGVSIYDSEGKLKDANTIFWETLDALGKIEDPVLRDGAAMELMGKSAQELNPLIKAGSEEIQKLMKAAEDLGLVMGEDQVKQLANLNDSWDTLKLQFSAAGSAIAANLAPHIEDLLKKVSEYLPKIVDFITGLIDKFFALDPNMQKFILSLIGIVAAIGPVLVVAGTLATAFAALASPVGVVILVITALIALAALIVINWEPISEFFVNLWNTITDGVVSAWTAIKEFFIGIWQSISDAATEIWDGIVVFFTETIPAKFQEFKTFFVNLFLDIINKVKTFATDLFTEAKKAGENLVNGVISFVKGLPDGLWTWFIVAIAKLTSFATDAYNKAKEVGQKIVDGIVGAVAALPGKVGEIISGVWSNVTDTISNIKNALSGAVSSVTSGIKSLVTPSSSTPVVKNAEGGVFLRPTLLGNHLFGEAGPEAIVPLDKYTESSKPSVIQVILDGRVIQEYMDNGLGNSLAAFGGV